MWLGHRRSIRLPGYDYSQNGYYFVTICTQNRDEIFGDIHEGIMHLNPVGNMIKEIWYRLPTKYPHIHLYDFIIMPNHFHGILIINNVGANPCIRPLPLSHITENYPNALKPIQGDNVVSPLRIPNTYSGLGRYISWFKRISTNRYINHIKNDRWPPLNQRLWQRNYWEHIIRNEKEYWLIQQYMINNPQNWNTDQLNHLYHKWRGIRTKD